MAFAKLVNNLAIGPVQTIVEFTNNAGSNARDVAVSDPVLRGIAVAAVAPVVNVVSTVHDVIDPVVRGVAGAVKKGAVSFFSSASNILSGVPDWADGDWIPASELLECVQLGDIIQFKVDWKIYTHFAIYVGDGFIVHISKENAGEKFQVVKDTLIQLTNGAAEFRINNLSEAARSNHVEPLSPDEIVRRALSEVGTSFDYALLADNCETFVTKCRYGKGFTCQPAILPKAFMAGNMLAKNSGRFHGMSDDEIVDFIFDKYSDNILG